MYKKLNLKNIKKYSAILLIGSCLCTTMPVIADEAVNTSSTVEDKVEQNNYIKDSNSYYAIKTNNKTPEELFEEKAKFLLGEDVYQNQYLKNENVSSLKNEFDKMYGEGAFLKLKEYEIRSKNLSKMELFAELTSAGLSCGYEERQISIFPNSEYRDEKQNIIDALRIKISAITNIQNNEQSMYETVYNMNEFVSACLGNASLNGSINSFDIVWNKYKKEIINPVVALINEDGILREYNAMNCGKYLVYNEVENNPYKYNLKSTYKTYIK